MIIFFITLPCPFCNYTVDFLRPSAGQDGSALFGSGLSGHSCPTMRRLCTRRVAALREVACSECRSPVPRCRSCPSSQFVYGAAVVSSPAVFSVDRTPAPSTRSGIVQLDCRGSRPVRKCASARPNNNLAARSRYLTVEIQLSHHQFCMNGGYCRHRTHLDFFSACEHAMLCVQALAVRGEERLGARGSHMKAEDIPVSSVHEIVLQIQQLVNLRPDASHVRRTERLLQTTSKHE